MGTENGDRVRTGDEAITRPKPRTEDEWLRELARRDAERKKAQPPEPKVIRGAISRAMAGLPEPTPAKPADDVVERLRRQQFASALARDLGPRYAPDKATLKTFRCDTPAQSRVVEQLRRLAARLPEMAKAGEGLILFGSCGTGKDHLLAAMLYDAVYRHGIECRAVSGPAFFLELRSTFNANDRRQEADVIRRLAAPTILGISDPITPFKDLSPWELSELHTLIDLRYQHGRPTWITVNAQHEQELREILTAAVVDRLQHGAHLVPCLWQSYRTKAS